MKRAAVLENGCMAMADLFRAAARSFCFRRYRLAGAVSLKTSSKSRRDASG